MLHLVACRTDWQISQSILDLQLRNLMRQISCVYHVTHPFIIFFTLVLALLALLLITALTLFCFGPILVPLASLLLALGWRPLFCLCIARIHQAVYVSCEGVKLMVHVHLKDAVGQDVTLAYGS